MRKRVLPLLLSLVLCATLLPVSAAALEDGTFEYSIKDNQATIHKYIGPQGNDVDIVIPSTLGGCPVTAIGRPSSSGAFASVKARSVTMPDSITSLDHYAFSSCTATTYRISNNLKEVGDSAFLSTKATAIDLPDSVTNLGTGVFQGSALTSFRMPAGVKKIDYDTFYACKSLETVTLNAGLEEIGKKAFENCPALKSLQLPASVKTIGRYAFEGCKSLTSINIPNGVTTISFGAFDGCKALQEIEIPRSVTRVEGDAFRDCDSLIDLIIPNTVTYLADVAMNCDNLESLTIPSSVKEGSMEYGGSAPKLIVYVNPSSYAASREKTKDKLSVIDDASVDSDIHVRYNGRRVSFGKYGQNPVITGGRTMVPLRSIFETMGAAVQWDDATRSVTATRGSTVIKMTVGQTDFTVNGQTKTLDVAPRIIGGRTVVPVRAIAEGFGANVGWNGDARIVSIRE